MCVPPFVEIFTVSYARFFFFKSPFYRRWKWMHCLQCSVKFRALKQTHECAWSSSGSCFSHTDSFYSDMQSFMQNLKASYFHITCITWGKNNHKKWVSTTTWDWNLHRLWNSWSVFKYFPLYIRILMTVLLDASIGILYQIQPHITINPLHEWQHEFMHIK